MAQKQELFTSSSEGGLGGVWFVSLLVLRPWLCFCPCQGALRCKPFCLVCFLSVVSFLPSCFKLLGLLYAAQKQVVDTIASCFPVSLRTESWASPGSDATSPVLLLPPRTALLLCMLGLFKGGGH